MAFFNWILKWFCCENRRRNDIEKGQENNPGNGQGGGNNTGSMPPKRPQRADTPYPDREEGRGKGGSSQFKATSNPLLVAILILLLISVLTIAPPRYCYCDAAEPWQLGFQDAATPMMQGSEGGSSGWTSFDLGVLDEPFSGEDGVLLESFPETQSSGTTGSVNQPPGGMPVPPANSLASGEAEAGPSHVVPYPYQEDEVIGGDSVISIRNRLLANHRSPPAEVIQWAQIEAEDLFEVKVDIIRQMIPLDPEGDWPRRGARALENPRTLTGEESLEKLSGIRDDVLRKDSTTIKKLRERMLFLRSDEDAGSQA